MTAKTKQPVLHGRAGAATGDAAPRRGGGLRKDIQGLRAIAVLAVLAFHLWPEGLRGGYVGVDIFFVISGFLITGHLWRKVPTRPSDLTAFYASRARRLLPAATLVLLVTLLAALVTQPASMVPRTAIEAAAAALYVENWELARSATDYLASHDAPSPMQHFWSLSVEEQFYMFWPVLIGGMALLARRLRLAGVAVVATGLAAVFALSLYASIHLTRTNPSRAYFVTPTRVWELALGGLLALGVSHGLAPRSRRAASAMVLMGTVMMAGSIALMSSRTPFPGSAALVPTLGAAMVIFAAPRARGTALVELMSHPVSQYVGDRSYAIYLWHWPMVVLLPFAVREVLTPMHKLLVVAVTVVLAALTKRWVEDPIRTHRRLTRNSGRSLAMGLVCVLVVLGAGAAVHARVSADQERTASEIRNGLAGATSCFAADAVRNRRCPVEGGSLLTTPVFAAADKPDVYADDCWANRPFARHQTCTYGAQRPTKRIALLGNSHAGHWQPAVARDAAAKGWQITTYLVSECYPVFEPVSFAQPGLTENCGRWTSWAVNAIAEGDYDLVVASSRTLQPLRGVPPADQRQRAKVAYGETLRRLTARGTPVLVIRDVPGMTGKVPDCVAAHAAALRSCDRPEREAIPRDPLADAARADPSGLASVVDLNGFLCPADVCRAVLGGAIVFFDHGHLTKTVAASLAPEVQRAMRKRMR
ncbi:acyltransferase family protein [Phycicoccus sp. SLBN-51]|uniref:acyltransferase family protein n=1 Tax=Phycicoccus sp. SLBN-51 TaxID=2768447 RepID=UPI00116D1B6B|nr:acyltransferase family protein [Phycicoccus sp. SLBN-51]TQJ48850.1 peptidoglycan/LPS O-acetylase OafA/YrhL [Phycicoccus sp. SLBN-51]